MQRRHLQVRPGYLSIQTHDAHRGRVRILISAQRPAVEPDSRTTLRIRYTARFNDCDAALMHTHELLKRRLLDPDAHLYRVDLARAIAAVESVELRRETVFWDPQLNDDTRTQVAELVTANRASQRRKDRFFQTLGYIGIAILLFNLFVLSFV
jgi:hypothetical protein